jgi:hypothetical protein
VDFSRQAITLLHDGQGAGPFIKASMFQRHSEQVGDGLHQKHVLRTVEPWRAAVDNKPAQDVLSRRNRHDHTRASELIPEESITWILVRGSREVCDYGRVIGEQSRAE